MKGATVISLGSINADFQVRVNHPVGSSDMLQASQFERFSGGKSANTAFLAARLGHRSVLLGRVGDDELAQQALDPLADAGVNVSGVTRASGKPTGLSMILVPPDCKKHIALAPNANDSWDEEAIASIEQRISRVSKPACLIINYEIPAPVVRRAVEAAGKQGLPVILDPSFADRVERTLLRQMHCITPNVTETAGLVGRNVKSVAEAAGAAAELRNSGVQLVCVKLGDGGCVLASRDELIHIPAAQVDVSDTTGAGDAFTTALAVALLEDRSPREAAAWGVASANLAVTGYGSQAAYAERRQIIDLAENLLAGAEAIDVRT
jgi:ribokinase